MLEGNEHNKNRPGCPFCYLGCCDVVHILQGFRKIEKLVETLHLHHQICIGIMHNFSEGKHILDMHYIFPINLQVLRFILKTCLFSEMEGGYINR